MEAEDEIKDGLIIASLKHMESNQIKALAQSSLF